MKRVLSGFVLLFTFLSTILAIEPSGTLPIIYIETVDNQEINSKEKYVDATYYLVSNSSAEISDIGSASEPLKLQIRGRGNYTWTGFDKKPYRLKLDKKQSLCGMNKSKHWALLAHADDNRAFLRNALGFELSRMVGLPWTPGDYPVEVVLNGSYIGLYFLTETVRVDSDRVDVWDYDDAYDEYAKQNGGAVMPWDDEYTTGGWLIEIDNYDDEDQIKFRSIDPNVPDKTIRLTYDTPSDYITQAHKDWLLDEFKTLDLSIINGDRDKCEWSDKIDLTNLARFFVVQQIVFNYESFHGSCKLWREKGADAKWNFGPVWDFGSAIQNRENKMFYDYGNYSNHWVEAMYEYPVFRDEVKRVYTELRSRDFDKIYDYIDNFVSKIEDGASRDLKRWPKYGNSDLKTKASGVKSFLQSSVKYFDNQTGYVPTEIDPDGPTSDIYLRGSMNNWSAPEEYKFEHLGNGYYQLNLSTLTGEWKIAGPNWGEGNVDYGYGAKGAKNDKVLLDTPTPLTFAGANISLSDEIVNDVVLSFNWKDKTLIVSHSAQTGRIEDYIENINPEYYNLQGVRVSHPTKGVYIERRGTVVRKIKF